MNETLKKRIEQAAKKYADEQGDFGINWHHAVEDFAAGAHWRISSVWHDASESPRTGDRIIVIDEDYHIVDVGYFGNSDRIMDGHRWAYINDLLPERKEEAK